MTEPVNRRTFLGSAASAGVALSLTGSSLAGDEKGSASDHIVVGIMGTGGRGTALARTFAGQKGVTVAYVCDVDRGRVDNAAAVVTKVTGKTPKTTTNFRDILDDQKVDALVIATCNHWHGPAAILACQAGKHVYVEKPCSHNPHEGELMVQAARKYKRQMQMGNQRRSYPHIIEGIEEVKSGAIGRCYFVQTWYDNVRPSIGRGKAVDPPRGLDYELWQGPAPRKPFRSNYLHYNWHWFWHWGNGEVGNNGVHFIDLCRWGLEVDYPVHVTSSGGRYRYDDDQETPDTHTVCFEFEGKKAIRWEGLSCNQLPGGMPGIARFFGEKGSLALRENGFTVYDIKGKEVRSTKGRGTDPMHIGNFLSAIRGSAKLTSEIEEAYKSTLLCHLGNIAQRTGHALRCDPKNGHILEDKQAQALWTREYAKGYEPRV
jgi:predicted dehydrogenase